MPGSSHAESLAGRVGIVHLLGLSRREQDGQAAGHGPLLPTPDSLGPRLVDATALPLPLLYVRIWRGSYPALTSDPGLDRDLYFSSYVWTCLQRDVRDLARIGDETAFLRFVRACAARTAQLLNVADLARDADVAPNTAKHWLSVLEASGQSHPHQELPENDLAHAGVLAFRKRLGDGIHPCLEFLEAGGAKVPGVDPNIYALPERRQVAVAVTVEMPGSTESALPGPLGVVSKYDSLVFDGDLQPGLQTGIGITAECELAGFYKVVK